MPYQELPGIGMQGLNTDTPAQALDQAYFSAGNNMRPFDGSLQTVFDFVSTGTSISDPDRSNIHAFTHWIQTGSTTFRAGYLYLRESDNKYVLQVIDDITGSTPVVTGAEADTDLVTNNRWGLQLFYFNGVLIANDSNSIPVVITYNADMDEYTAVRILGWLGDDVTCERLVQYNNRLVALNLNGEYLDGTLGNATLVWSTPIEELDSLDGLTFQFTSNNSAGDDILTETPGEVLDAGTLGTYLIVYKDDAVYRYTDTGSPLFLVGEPLFVDDGLYSPDCFVDIGGGRHFVMGNYGVYIHDGGPNKQNISRGRVQDTLYSAIETRDNTFVFHHQNDKEVWICYDTDISENDTPNIVNRAHVYNYEQDTWYTRNLPLGTRGINSIQQGGQLYIYAFGEDLDGDADVGVVRLSDERDIDTVHIAGDVEFHYLSFGDNSKVKYLSAIYPHSMSMVNLDIITTNNIGSMIDFTNDPPSQNFSGTADGYKLDFRVHGRYYHIKISSVGAVNPQMTGMGFNMKLAGDR